MNIDAILWDYDGTLVNSVPKNIAITKAILSVVAPHLVGENYPKYLLSESAYHVANHAAKNWQELYQEYYGLTRDETLVAGSMWAAYQDNDKTEVQLFDGISRVVQRFTTVPHGVCSQNSQSNIRRVLQQSGIGKQFHAVVGYDDVEDHVQKPHSYGGIKCLNQIFEHLNNKHIIYIGDHEADVQFARNLEQALGGGSTVVSVAAAYSGAQPDLWNTSPDYIAQDVDSLIGIIDNYT